MEKRYQVFVSSTFTDLKEERQNVLRGILELDHIPAGMELFPAADESAWQLIKEIIDRSDYYVLIIGGRYGSMDETGIGYTEKEYDYAVSVNKPVIPVLHANPDNLPREKTETDEAIWKKLKHFRGKIEKRHTCVFWNSPGELKVQVILGLTSAFKRHKAIGWIRADKIPTEDSLKEILALRKRVSELESEIEEDRSRPPKGIEDLAQGDDTFDVHLGFTGRRNGAEYPYIGDTEFTATINPNWNEIFAAVAPSMINETPDKALRNSIKAFISAYAKKEFEGKKDLKGCHLVDFKFDAQEIETCIVQIRALGLIKENTKARSVKDSGTYWTLTPYGDHLMVKLRAIKRDISIEAYKDSESSPALTETESK